LEASEIERSSRKSVTVRAVSVGLLLVVAVCVFASYAEYIAHGYRMGFGYITMALLIPFSVLVFVVNRLVCSLKPSWGLRREELIVVFMMGLVGSAMPTTRLTSHLVSVLAAPYYWQDPSNQWAEYLVPNIPRWLFPSDESGAMTYFFNGLPKGEQIPWDAWFGPMFWWLQLLAAIMLVTLAAFVILRKQWVENERLVFPLAQVPLEMVRPPEGKGRIPPIVKSKGFWIGFGISAGVILWNIFRFFSPNFPLIPTALKGINLGNIIPNVPPIHNRIHFLIMGFAFLANTQVLFSLWFFFAMALVEIAVFSKFGFNPKGAAATEFFVSGSYMGWQSFGGLTVIVFFALWRARRHLARVFKKAWNPSREDVNDSMEIMSYRAAVLSVVLGLIYIMFWLHKCGMDLKSVVLFVSCGGVLFIGLARIVSETGLVYVRPSMEAQAFVSGVFGVTSMSATSTGAIGSTYAIVGSNMGFVSAAGSHITKLSDSVERPKRSLFPIVFGSGMLGIVVSVVFTLVLAYRLGAINFNRPQFNHENILMLNGIVKKLKDPGGPNWTGISFFGAGAVVVAILSILMTRFAWWPLHPIGFTVNYVFDIRIFMLSIFIAWLVKYVTLKVGGVPAYRRVAPIFMGLIFGTVFGVIVTSAVDAIWFPGQGHDFWYGFQ